MKNIINRLLTERKDAKAQRVYLTTESTKGTEVFRTSCFRHLENPIKTKEHKIKHLF